MPRRATAAEAHGPGRQHCTRAYTPRQPLSCARRVPFSQHGTRVTVARLQWRLRGWSERISPTQSRSQVGLLAAQYRMTERQQCTQSCARERRLHSDRREAKAGCCCRGARSRQSCTCAPRQGDTPSTLEPLTMAAHSTHAAGMNSWRACGAPAFPCGRRRHEAKARADPQSQELTSCRKQLSWASQSRRRPAARVATQ
jgi:hypothetical protein